MTEIHYGRRMSWQGASRSSVLGRGFLRSSRRSLFNLLPVVLAEMLVKMVLARETVFAFARAPRLGTVHCCSDMDRDLVAAQVSRPAETARTLGE